MFSLICAWTNGLKNHRDAGDLSRHHYVIVMIIYLVPPDNNQPFFTSASVDQDLPTPYGVTEPQWINGRPFPLPWRHNGRDGGSNHQPHHCLLNRLFGRWSKKTSKLRITDRCAGKGWVLLTPHFDDVITGAMASQVTSLTIVYSTVYSDAAKKKTPKLRVPGICAGNSPGTGVFPAHMASNAEIVSIWWRHHRVRILAQPNEDNQPIPIPTRNPLPKHRGRVTMVNLSCYLNLLSKDRKTR